MRLKDKVILVTGSTTGIGEGMARIFTREGARVVVHGTREEAARKLVAELGGPDRAGYVLGALDDPAVPEKVVAAVIKQFGRIDGLVNNAAVMTRGTLDQTDLALFERVMAINLRAPLFLIKAALPHFRKQGEGRVLNIGSINSYCGEKTQLVYSMAKAGMVTMTKNLADAHAREGLRVNAFNVGWTLTPNEYELKMREGLTEGWPTRVPKTVAPFGRILSPEDIAWAAVYFLSDEAPLINGSVLDLEQYPMSRNPPREEK